MGDELSWGHRFLLCPPQHFAVAYEINPWMSTEVGIDRDRAQAQWEGLKAALEQAGARVEVQPPDPAVPDLVFTANAGIVSGRRFVPSQFRHPERQPETAIDIAWFEQAGYEVAGFRAPFFAAPEGLSAQLVSAGYAYNASAGRLHPFSRAPGGPDAGRGDEPLPTLELSALGLLGTPFSLTWLRLLGRAGLSRIPAVPGVFCCHLHELVDGSEGWQRLPPPLRALHRRRSGQPALALVDEMLARPDLRFVTCGELLETTVSASDESLLAV